MRLSGRLYGGMVELGSRLARVRYFRGHGVHSPYVFRIVREVFMRRELLPGDREVYNALLAAGLEQRRAVQLQNLCIHCGYTTFGLNHAVGEFRVIARDVPQAETFAQVQAAAVEGCTVALLAPYDGRKRQALCRQLVASHLSTSVDNRAYLLLFNNHLPKQHFRI